MTQIIAVAAPIGGGKTSLVNAIAEKLQDASTIHFDHYEKITQEPIENLMQWMDKGADFNDLPIPGLPEDLERLKRGKSVTDPLTGRSIYPEQYIIFEMPLGREHRDTAEYIDLLLWVDIPFDIALARKIREFVRDFLSEQEPEKHKDCLNWIDQYLYNYLKIVREVLSIQKQKVSANADIIVNGQDTIETMVQHATKEILNLIP